MTNSNETKITLEEFSKIIENDSKYGFDIFDMQLDGDILNIEDMCGTVADREGENIIEFKIVSVDEDDQLNTIISVNLLDINLKNKVFEVGCIHDREGYTKVEIMTQQEIEKKIEEWEIDNSLEDLFSETSILRTSQTYGIIHSVVIDVRGGEISIKEDTPNQYNNSDSFFITLCEQSELDDNDHDICEGDLMEIEISTKDLRKIFINSGGTGFSHYEFKELMENLEYEKSGNKIKISWWKNTNTIEAETFVNLLMDDSWNEWKKNYEDFHLEDLSISLDPVGEYYQQLWDSEFEDRI